MKPRGYDGKQTNYTYYGSKYPQEADIFASVARSKNTGSTWNYSRFLGKAFYT